MVARACVTGIYLAVNFWSAILIIWSVKWVLLGGFHWTVALTLLHAGTTALGLHLLWRVSSSRKKNLSSPLAIIEAGPGLHQSAVLVNNNYKNKNSSTSTSRSTLAPVVVPRTSCSSSSSLSTPRRGADEEPRVVADVVVVELGLGKNEAEFINTQPSWAGLEKEEKDHLREHQIGDPLHHDGQKAAAVRVVEDDEQAAAGAEADPQTAAVEELDEDLRYEPQISIDLRRSCATTCEDGYDQHLDRLRLIDKETTTRRDHDKEQQEFLHKFHGGIKGVKSLSKNEDADGAGAASSRELLTPRWVTDLTFAEAKKLFALSLTYSFGILVNNNSLRYNAVSMFQLLKVLITPVTLLLQYVLYGKTVGRQEVCALALMCIGTTIATVYHLEANAFGFFFGMLGVLLSSLQQIWNSEYQKQLKLTPPQLTYTSSCFACLILVPLVFLLEKDLFPRGPPGAGEVLLEEEASSSSSVPPTTKVLFSPPSWASPGLVFWLCVSCVVACVVSTSAAGVLGHTSPLTYQVMARMKAVFIVMSGYLVFNEEPTFRSSIGICVTAIAIVWYTKLKLAAYN
ncbi:unnamed protein product [Amoebophrya sp. A120]|nr:unnamed protein product [Amoebophrya sp. A120]|eukprot:GSA120T00020602001.1